MSSVSIYIPYEQKDIFISEFPTAKYNNETNRWVLNDPSVIRKFEIKFCLKVPYDKRALARSSGGVWIPDLKKWMFLEEPDNIDEFIEG